MFITLFFNTLTLFFISITLLLIISKFFNTQQVSTNVQVHFLLKMYLKLQQKTAHGTGLSNTYLAAIAIVMIRICSRLLGSKRPMQNTKKLLLIQQLLVPGMGKNLPSMPLPNWPNSFEKESTLIPELAIYC